jgi:hypothetical protein
MQPIETSSRPARMLLRALAAIVLALGLLAAPTASVQACSCAALGGPMDVVRGAIASADVAFIGTVVDFRPAPDLDGFGPMVAYAFDVERATVPIAEVIEVRALDDGGGASCGFTFGMDETWFVTTDQQDGALHTGLCSANTQLETLAEAEQEQIAALLTAEPFAAPAASDEFPWLPVGATALAILAVGAIMAVAFRRTD